MKKDNICSANRLLVAAIFLLASFALPQMRNDQRPWKGNAILGNGNICIVYSDDPRITSRDSSRGIRHLYFRDYSVDYMRSSSVRLLTMKGADIPLINDSIGMKPFYAAFTRKNFSSGYSVDQSVFVHKENMVIVRNRVTLPNQPVRIINSFNVRGRFIGGKQIKLRSLTVQNNRAVAVWDNNTVMIAGCEQPEAVISVKDSTISVRTDIFMPQQYSIILSIDDNAANAGKRLDKITGRDLKNEADIYWRQWIAKASKPIIDTLLPDKYDRIYEFFKRNLYALKSANLNGQVPADMTGQFVTNNMPQLYPRDAMMAARIFLSLNCADEAKQIISFWCKAAIPKKSPGEFFARYDANASAVDGGSGARYDEPEWDANGYLIQLLNQYHEKTKEWLAPKEFIYSLADFIVSKIDSSGLLYEGGIVEWTGYLPTTNMICATALKTVSSIAYSFKDSLRGDIYKTQSARMTRSLFQTFDLMQNTYAAVRYHGIKNSDNSSIAEKSGEKMFLWDGTMQFAVLWGYPLEPLLQSTVSFYETNLIALGGGMQYFQAADGGGLSGYGGDVFFFTTASLAQYYAMFNAADKARAHIDWMMKNSNIYGLMPERIYLNESDCSDASPLSWCCGEFAAAAHLYLTKVWR